MASDKLEAVEVALDGGEMPEMRRCLGIHGGKRFWMPSIGVCDGVLSIEERGKSSPVVTQADPALIARMQRSGVRI